MRITIKAAKALNQSVDKWRQCASGVRVAAGAYDCPLCVKFHDRDDENDCTGCPIQQDTGKMYCRGTPYAKYEKAKHDIHFDTPILTAAKKLKKFAKAEYKYLLELQAKCTTRRKGKKVKADQIGT